MHKNMLKMAERDTIRAARVQRTADITGVTPRAVRYILNGERENDDVLMVYMEIKEMEEKLDNDLKNEVNKLVPFN